MSIELLAALALAAAAPPVGPADSAAFVAGEYASEHGRRRYKLYIPKGWQADRPAPLVVLLHGCTQDADDFARGTRFNEHAAASGALVLYPEQSVEANARKCWNWFEPAHQSTGAGEPALIAGMTEAMAAKYRADARRVYIGGLSAGAAMAVLTAVAYPDLYAAVASHSGVGWRTAHDLATALAAMQGASSDADSLARAARREMGGRARIIPLFALHGTLDSIVRPAATRHLVEQFVALDSLVLGHRVVSDASSSGKDSDAAGAVRVRRYRDAGGRVLIEEWLVDGVGHAWSGGCRDGSWTDEHGPDATREIMRFFLAHTRGEP